MPSVEHLWRQAADKRRSLEGGPRAKPFSALVRASNPNSETMDVIHAYGRSTGIRTIHPYIGTNSWHRIGVEPGQRIMLHVRADTNELAASSYIGADARDTTPEVRISNYKAAKDVYRPLELGEQEIHSAGLAQVYLSRRPVLDSRGGYVRSWLDQDSLEAGARAVTHVRELHLQGVGKVGDEERFGGVSRPDATSKVFRKFIDAPQDATSAVNPQSNVSEASDAASAVSDPSSAAAAAESAAASAASSTTEPAKEYLYILKTGSGTLIDHREGHVTDDTGQFVEGKLNGKLRFRKKIYGSMSPDVSGAAVSVPAAGAGTETWEEQVNENGDWYVGLPQNATTGIKFEVPAGKFVVKSGTASSDMEFDGTQGTILIKATQEATMRGESGLKLHSAQVKIGQTEAAVNKVYATTTKKAAQLTLHGGLSASQIADGLLHAADAAAHTGLAVVNTAAMACPLTPGVIVGLLGMAHSLIPVIMRSAGVALKIAKSGFSAVYVGTQDTHESNTVSISS